MKKVIVRGPSLTQSGYGVHCRQIARWALSKENFQVKFQALPWGDTPLILNKNLHKSLINKIVNNTVDLEVDKNHKYDISLQLQLPNEWDPSIAKFNVGLTAGVETDKCNPKWIENCNKMDMIIVPSEHAANSLKNAGPSLEKPLFIIPESFSDSIIEDKNVKDFNLPKFSTNFNFLIFGQITGDNPFNDRKNIFFTIKWLCEAFKNDKDVGIIIKTNMGRNTKIDQKKTELIVKAVVKECRKGEFPKIHLLHGDMSDSTVASLYKHPQVKCLISLSRGEGYGLPILEAAASGLPIIATNWSGYLDFLKHGKFIPVSYDLKEVHSSRIDERIFMKNSKWAETHEDDFKKKVLKFRDSSSVPKEWAENLSKIIIEKYSFNAISKMYDKVLNQVL